MVFEKRVKHNLQKKTVSEDKGEVEWGGDEPNAIKHTLSLSLYASRSRRITMKISLSLSFDLVKALVSCDLLVAPAQDDIKNRRK